MTAVQIQLKTSFPSWDNLLADFAQIILDNELYPGISRDYDNEILPSWDVLLADLAQIIQDDALYPEEMPLECFDII